MSKRPSRTRKPKNSNASFTRSKLCQEIGTDPRTVSRRCAHLGITAERRKRVTDPIRYTLTPDQLQALSKPLPRGNGSGTPDSDLKRSKLKEEVEHLRLKNRKLRSESTPNRIVAQFLLEAKDAIPDLIERHLDRYADDAAGKEPAEIRGIGKQANDDIRAGIDAFLCQWLPAFDGE